MATNYSNRGKEAEKLLKNYLEQLAVTSSCASHRLPDAHAGSLTAALCDFLFMQNGRLCLVECKETQHAFRLPHKNVDTGQIGRMRLWQFAGANAFVMIYHKPLQVWRSAPVDYFLSREGGSWDMSSIPTTDISTAFYRYANANRT